VTVSTVEKAEFPEGYVIFENVPAQECRNCGELWFSMETMRQIEVAAKRERPPLRKIEVPLYDLASSAAV